MAQHWRCSRCGTFHGRTSRFQDEPDECRECGHAEFETLGTTGGGGMGFAVSRSLNLDAFTWMAMGMAIYNVLFALLGGFANSRALMYSAGISFVAMLLVAYFLSSRSKTAWTFSLAVFIGVVIWGLVIVVPRIMQFFEMAPPIPVYAQNYIFLVYGVLYVVLGFTGLAMLLGGRDAIRGPESAEPRSSG